MKKPSFKQKVILWLLSHGLSTDVLSHPKLKAPMKQKDPVWVHEVILQFGGAEYTKLSAPRVKLELMLLTGTP